MLIAEGVEQEAELAVLCELGFDAVQGYLLCRPLPVDQLPGDVLDGAASARLLARVRPRPTRGRALPRSITAATLDRAQR